jgi:WhiB family transcriptional regulator, redox-sensing transcriptional regulator
MEWVRQARCIGVDPELFFPVGSTGPALAQVEAAKAVCAMCPVRPECLTWALATGQDAGVWGGTSEEERRVMRGIRPEQVAVLG